MWDEPFLNIPRELGPYAYTTLNVRLASIRDEPDTVRKFVKGVMRGLKFTQESREEAAQIAKLEFPSMAAEDLKATLERSYADEAWSFDGTVSQQSWTTASAVVLEAGILKHVYDTLKASHGADVAKRAIADSVRASALAQAGQMAAAVGGIADPKLIIIIVLGGWRSRGIALLGQREIGRRQPECKNCRDE